MTTYNITYYYNFQPTITDTEEDLTVDYPYFMLHTLLDTLTDNQRKNLKKIEITSGVSDKHKEGYKRIIDLAPTSSFYKVLLATNKSLVTKGDKVTLTVTVTNITTVTKVELFNNTTKLTELTSAPYTYTYTTDTYGSNTLFAKVTDSDTVTTVSNLVNLQVN